MGAIGGIGLIGGNGGGRLPTLTVAPEGAVGASGLGSNELASASVPSISPCAAVDSGGAAAAVVARAGTTANNADTVSGLAADSATGSAATGTTDSGDIDAGGASAASIEIHTSGGGRLASIVVTLPLGS